MPTETFLRLTKEKREKLLDAAKDEFKLHVLEEASINQIIKKAGISRGSFYTYFTSKEDLYFYLIEQFSTDFYNAISRALHDNAGDFIKASIDMFHEILSHCTKEENKDFFRNVFLNLKYTSGNYFLKPKKEKMLAWQEGLTQQIDNTLYGFKSEKEVEEAFGLVMMLTNMSLAHIFMHPENREQEKEAYLRKLHMLQYGIYKKEENQ